MHFTPDECANYYSAGSQVCGIVYRRWRLRPRERLSCCGRPSAGGRGHFAAALDGCTRGTAATELVPSDRHLQGIAEKGRIGWQKISDYNKRSRIEAAIGRYRQVIGDGLRSRKDGRWTTEVGVAVHVLNRIPELGHPISVRIG
jgi:hypothetical protein